MKTKEPVITRIEIINDYKTIDEAMTALGFVYDGRYYYRDGIKYKWVWCHSNSWGQMTYIDVLEIENNN